MTMINKSGKVRLFVGEEENSLELLPRESCPLVDLTRHQRIQSREQNAVYESKKYKRLAKYRLLLI